MKGFERKNRKSNYLFVTLSAFYFSFFISPVLAQAPQWRVQPKVCIVASLGDTCEMDLRIQLHHLEQDDYCIYQDTQVLKCWSAPLTEIRLPIRFSKDTLLTLKSKNELLVLTHKMDIKAREGKKMVRRVRQPWSLF